MGDCVEYVPAVEAGVENAAVADAREAPTVRARQRIGGAYVEFVALVLVQQLKSIGLSLSLIHIVLPIGHAAAEK